MDTTPESTDIQYLPWSSAASVSDATCPPSVWPSPVGGMMSFREILTSKRFVPSSAVGFFAFGWSERVVASYEMGLAPKPKQNGTPDTSNSCPALPDCPSAVSLN